MAARSSQVIREAERSSLIQLSNSQKDPERGSSEEEISSFRRNSQNQGIKEASDHQSRSTEAERSSYQKEKGKAIMRGLGDLVRGRVGTLENLEAETQVVETSFVCACCYRGYQYENMVHCRDGHLFCFKCIRRQVDEIIYGGDLRAHANGSLSCMDIYQCKQSILLPEIRKVIPNDVLEKYEYRVAQAIVEEAHIENLVHCPFCNIPYEIDKCVQVLDCPNPKCLKSSCIQCKEVSHLPLSCEEVDNKSAETALRRKVEERMANAVIRKCNICEVELIKVYGCNSLTCRCGNRMCYLCRKTLSDVDSSHFCNCITRPYMIEEGKICPRCNKCSECYEPGDDEALAAKEEALKELVDKNPELLDLAIGPPLITAKEEALKELVDKNPELLDLAIGPPLITQTQRTTRIRHPPEFNAHGDQLANMHAPPPLAPPQFLRDHNQTQRTTRIRHPPEFNAHGDQLANMHAPPPLAPPQFLRDHNQTQRTTRIRHPPEFNAHGDQLANMHAPPPQAPPQFLRDHNQTQRTTRIRHPPEFNAHGDQLANMHAPPPLAPPQFLRDHNRLARIPLNPTLPPQDFFRFGNGGQFSNMAVPESLPPLLFVRNGNVGQLENMGVPAQLPPQHFFRYGKGGQFSNMAVPAPAPSTPYLTLPPQEFFRYGNCGQPANIAVRPPLPPPHFVRYANGGQRANMAVPAPLPPQHFIRYGNGGQPANMAAPAPLPPQYFVRYGNGGQLANMAAPDLGALLPPQHFFRYVNGGHPANMAVPAPLSQEHFFRYANGSQYANRNLPEQQDYGRRLQRPSH